MKFNLSEITGLIQSRRTVTPEHYTTRKVHKEQIEKMLQNAVWAPNHKLTQPWRFHVFTDGGLQKLSTFLGETYLKLTPKEQQNDAKLAKMLRRPMISSVVIAVSMKRQEEEKIPEIEEVEAVACAIQNLHLSCTAYGLGGFWATPKVIYSEEMTSFLGLSSRDKCLGIFYLGYPDIEWPQAHRRPIEYNTTWISE